MSAELSPDRLSNQEIGERLRTARRTAKFTQAEAAASIQVARTTLVAIEQGQRPVKIPELQVLAHLYGTSANAILRQSAIHLDLVPQFRSLQQTEDQSTELASRLLTELVSAEVELENALGIQRHHNYPREKHILPGNVYEQAEQDAQDLRDWLGLGIGPVKDIVSLVNLEIGIRIYVRDLDSRISGLFAYDSDVGACILLNGKHPAGRQAQTVAHELGHFTSTRDQPEILHVGSTPRSRQERYANSFARAFLTPRRSVKQRFEELTAGHSHFTRRHVILLAHSFGVSREAIVRRLEELGLIRNGTWDWFQTHGGITDKQVDQVLGSSASIVENESKTGESVPPRLALLAREAWKKNLISEGQLAQLLKLHRIEIRQLLEGVEAEIHEADELVELS